MRLGALPDIWLVRTLHCSSLMCAGLGAKPDEYMRAKVDLSIRTRSLGAAGNLGYLCSTHAETTVSHAPSPQPSK
jgi:hypothetical protein